MSAFSSASSDSESEETTAQLNDAQDEEKDIDDVNELEDDAEEAEEADEDFLPPDDFTTITAMPPKAIAYEENHMEVSASPAFHVLDTVSSLFDLVCLCDLPIYTWTYLPMRCGCWVVSVSVSGSVGRRFKSGSNLGGATFWRVIINFNTFFTRRPTKPFIFSGLIT